jgi:hypothetical protein
MDGDSGAAKRPNKKKLENLERLRRKREVKESKNKARKRKQLADRKCVKETVYLFFLV